MQTFYAASTAIYQAQIGRSAFKVFSYLSSCADYKTRECWPKRRTIAAKCGISVRSVVRAVKELCQKRLILKKAQYERYEGDSDVRQKENRYILIDSPQMSLEASKAGRSAAGVKSRQSAVTHQKGRVVSNRLYRAKPTDLSVLSGNELKIYNYITLRAGSHPSCFLSKTEIATGCGVSAITVYRCIKVLEEYGLLAIRAQTRRKITGDNGTACNRYVLLAPRSAEKVMSKTARVKLLFAFLFLHELSYTPISAYFVTGGRFTTVTPGTNSPKNKTQKKNTLIYKVKEYAGKLRKLFNWKTVVLME